MCDETIHKAIQTPKSYNLEITTFVNKIIINATFFSFTFYYWHDIL